jgi:HAD superfamily hydrolase (TIGR01509 family)
MRDVLHTVPEITEAVVDRVCLALRLEPSDFPRDLPVAPLMLFPGTVEALRALSDVASVVTLSNVTCTEADPERLLGLLSPWVSAHFPSCRIGYAKPDDRAFQTVAEECGVELSRIVHVGDDWECDIQGATNAGARAVWISHGRTIPDPRLLVEQCIRVAHDLVDAVTHVRHHLTRSDS